MAVETVSEYLERLDPQTGGAFGGLGRPTEYRDAKGFPVYPAGGEGGFPVAWWGSTLQTRDTTICSLTPEELGCDPGERLDPDERWAMELAQEVE
ncbi:MAG TPA: hypothetical protein VGG32_06970 [Thermoplasmata archaeon]|jgi:hypothetical protein